MGSMGTLKGFQRVFKISCYIAVSVRFFRSSGELPGQFTGFEKDSRSWGIFRSISRPFRKFREFETNSGDFNDDSKHFREL